MDVSSLASLATQMSASQTGTQLGIAVLKSALDTQTQSTQMLIEALSQGNLPDHLGQNVNTTA
jgi:hypothetical protein